MSNGLTYEEQREVNVKRNYERLVEMNLVKEKKSRDISGGDIEGADNDNQSASSVKNHYGMIFPTNYNGLPIAKTDCPTFRFSDIPTGIAYNTEIGALIFKTAKSFSGATPISSAGQLD